MLKKPFLLFIAVLLITQQSAGQNLKDFSLNITPPDPEAASLGTYGNYNFNLSAGQVDISIPLTTVKGRTLNYPVGLSYDHSGIKVDEKATCAGMNWTFTGIGMISRTVVGGPDEDQGYNTMYPLVDVLINQYPSQFYLDPPSSGYNAYFQLSSPPLDLQPDIYNYSFLGKSGKFFRDPTTGVFYTMPYSKLKITQMASTTSSVSYFNIVDEKGYTYKFNVVSATSTESDCNNDASASQNYIGQWYLTEVDAPDGNTEFTFEYTANNPVSMQSRSTTINYVMSVENLTPGCSNCSWNQTNSIYPEASRQSCLNTSFYGGLLLSKVLGPMQDLWLNYAAANSTDESLKLNDIELKTKDNILIQQWKFYDSYYLDNNTFYSSPPPIKLKLDSMAIWSVSGRESSYTFDYNGDRIPPVLSTCQDYWGYNNGQISNTTLVGKTFYNNQYLGDANRSPDLTSAEQGILTKIHYPTGGTSEFIYELNNYGKITTESNLVNDPVLTAVQPITLTVHNFEQVDNNLPTTVQTSFTLSDSTIVHFNTYRSNHDNVTCPQHQCANFTPCIGGHCQNYNNEPCSVVIKLSALLAFNPLSNINSTTNPNELSLNGSPSLQMDFMLPPGTYTLSIQADDDYNWGTATVTYKQITGHNKSKYCGGLRVKKIKNYDPLSNTYTTRKFSYIDATDQNRSSGVIVSEPYNISTYENSYDCINYQINNGPCNPSVPQPHLNIFWRYIVASQGNYELYYSNGQPVTYSRVIETIGENGEGGSIEHMFSIYNDEGNKVFPFPGSSPRFWRRGLPVLTNFYNTNGNLVSSEENSYAFEPNANRHMIRGIKVGISKNSTDPFMRQARTMTMNYISEWMYLYQNTKTQYYPNSTLSTVQTQYFYDNPHHLQATRVKTTQSDGSVITDYTRYPADYNPPSGSSDPAVSGLYGMLQKNMHNYPVEELHTLTRNNTESLTSSALNTYKQFGQGVNSQGQFSLWQQYHLSIASPTPYSATSPLSTVDASGNLSLNNNYLKKIEINSYNGYNNPLDVTQIGSRNTDFVWMYGGTYPVAEAKNTSSAQIAYTGFETIETGNWTYNTVGITTIDHLTGSSAYNLNSGNITGSVPGTGGVAIPYTVSYWSKSGPMLVNGGGPVITGATIGNWTYYEHGILFQGQSALPVTLSGGGIIDELRLYPATATMKTVTYNPLVGIVAETDEANHIRFYEYDGLGRLTLIKDQNGNIVKKVEYGIQKQE